MEFGNTPTLRSIFVRTPAGQREVVGDEMGLSFDQRRMLLLVNGYTSLLHLAKRLEDLPRPALQLQVLLEAGLVEEVGIEHLTYTEWDLSEIA
jgi:hypothetical protein